MNLLDISYSAIKQQHTLIGNEKMTENTNENKPFNERFKEIGALWKAKSGSGYTGVLGDARIVVFPNKYAAEDTRQPVLRMYEPIESNEE